MNRQIRFVGVGLLALFVALFAQLNWLQVVEAGKLADDPRNTRTAIRDFVRPRGTIQTADGVLLAQSIPTPDAPFERLRTYPEGDLFGPVTGYFSFTYGASGVEAEYGDVLAGRNLELQLKNLSDVLVDRTVVGNVTLSLRKDVQQVARDALGNRKGAVVALDPRTGAVLALWSFPSYDPSALSGHDQKAVQDAWGLLNASSDRPLLGRSFRERYPPGSTFKVVTAAAALEQAPELATKQYPQLKLLDLPDTDKDLPNFGGSTCGGTMADLLRVSCNTGFGQMGLDLGAEKLHKAAQDFGFTDRPPIDLPGAAKSVFPPVSAFDRNKPAIAQSAIGQRDVAATPLQMALVAAGIANGGNIMRPQVMAEIRDSEGALVTRAEPRSWRRAMSEENAETLKAMMIEVVTRGTATSAQIPGVAVAGKTGTAQTQGNNAHAWFIGFAPAEAPEVAIAVIVESQEGLGDITGGRVAAPIAQAVMRQILGR